MRALILSTLSLAIAVACATSGNAQEAGTWNGFYAGVSAGYAWDQNSASFGITALIPDPGLQQGIDDAFAAGVYPRTMDPTLSGAIAGFQAGYNTQLGGQVLAGVEADVGVGLLETVDVEVRPDQNFFNGTTTTVGKSVDWLGTVRGRVGILASKDLLVFATAGLAIGKTQLNVSNKDVIDCSAVGNLCGAASSTGTNFGWVAGAGIEASMSANWSLKAEYLYIDLGERTVSAIPANNPIVTYDATSRFATQTIRVGLNYHLE